MSEQSSISTIKINPIPTGQHGFVLDHQFEFKKIINLKEGLMIAHKRISDLFERLDISEPILSINDFANILTVKDGTAQTQIGLNNDSTFGSHLIIGTREQITQGDLTHEGIHMVVINQSSTMEVDRGSDFIIQRNIKQQGVQLISSDTLILTNFTKDKNELMTIILLLKSNNFETLKSEFPKQSTTLDQLFQTNQDSKGQFLQGIINNDISWGSDTGDMQVTLKSAKLNKDFNEAITALLTIMADNPHKDFKLPMRDYTDAGYHNEPWMQALLSKYHKLNKSDRLSLLKLLCKAINTDSQTEEFESISSNLYYKYDLAIDTISNSRTKFNGGGFIQIPKLINLIYGVNSTYPPLAKIK